jgi:hypothetical protein
MEKLAGIGHGMAQSILLKLELEHTLQKNNFFLTNIFLRVWVSDTSKFFYDMSLLMCVAGEKRSGQKNNL